MSKNLKKNYIFNVTYQLLTLILPLITMPYLSRVLQPETVGVFSYSESIVLYFSLFAVLGTAVYAQREIGKVQDSVEERSKVFWEIQIVRTTSSLIAIAAYIIYVFVIDTNFVVTLIFVLEIFNVVVDISWFFQGLEDFRMTIICGVFMRVCTLIFTFAFVKSSDDLWIYVLSRCGNYVFWNMLMWCLLPKYLCKVRGIKPFKRIKEIVSFFIPAIASQVYTMLDKSMLGWMTSTHVENGYYEYAEKLVRISITIISSLATVIVPRASKAHAEGDDESVKNIIYQATRYVWLIGIPIVLGLIAVADVFIPIYLGEGFEKSAILLQIFAPIVVIVGMANIIGVSFLIPMNKQKIYIISTFAAAAVNLCLNAILIPKLYSVGAAVASVVAELVNICIQFGYVFSRKMLRAKNVFLPLIRYLIAGVTMFFVVYTVKPLLSVSVWSLVELIAIGVVLYFVLLLILHDSFTFSFLKNFFIKIKTKFVKQRLTETSEIEITRKIETGGANKSQINDIEVEADVETLYNKNTEKNK